MVLHRFEMELIKNNNLVRILVPKARQMGVSTFGIARLVHRCIANNNIESLFLAHDKTLLRSSYSRLKMMLKGMEQFQPTIDKDISGQEISFDTGSSIILQSAGKGGVGRGGTFQHWHSTEMPSWDDPRELIDGAHESIPEISGWGSSIIHESTCLYKGDYWHFLIEQARTGKGQYKICFIPWYVERAYGTLDELTREHGVLSQKKLKYQGIKRWSPTCGVPLYSVITKELTTEEERIFNHIRSNGAKYGIDRRFLTDDVLILKLLWRRRKLENASSLESFQSEYPLVLDEAFRGIGASVFAFSRIEYHRNKTNTDGVFLSELPYGKYILEHDKTRDTILNGRVKQSWEIVPCSEDTTDEESVLRIWESPNKNSQYIIGVDPSHGIVDPCVMQIIKVEEDHTEQVGVFRSLVTAKEAAWIVAVLHKLFNNAFMVIERTGAGIPLLEELMEITSGDSHFIYQTERITSDGHTTTKELGFNTNEATREQLIQLIHNLLDNPKNIIRCPITLKEMEDYAYNKKGRADHQIGGHDDCLMAYGLAHKGIQQAVVSIRRVKNKVVPSFGRYQKRTNKVTVGRKVPKVGE